AAAEATLERAERAERELEAVRSARAEELDQTIARAETAEAAAARAREELEEARARLHELEASSGPPAIADEAGSAIAEQATASAAENGHVLPGVEHGLDPSSPEFEPRRAFLSQYLSTMRWSRRPVDGVDPLALP